MNVFVKMGLICKIKSTASKSLTDKTKKDEDSKTNANIFG